MILAIIYFGKNNHYSFSDSDGAYNITILYDHAFNLVYKVKISVQMFFFLLYTVKLNEAKLMLRVS